jgi:hypothetical protein
VGGAAAAVGMNARLLLDEHYSVDVCRSAASMPRRIVTENIADFRPMLVEALGFWLSRLNVMNRPDDDWLS